MENIDKYKKLGLSILFDAMGYVSYIVPGLGELLDVAWAPTSAYLMTKLYSGKKGKIAAAVAFIEEAMPGLDVIPTFTLMWLYTYVFDKKEQPTSEEIIDIEEVK